MNVQYETAESEVNLPVLYTFEMCSKVVFFLVSSADYVKKVSFVRLY